MLSDSPASATQPHHRAALKADAKEPVGKGGHALAKEEPPEADETGPVHAHGQLVELVLGDEDVGGADRREVLDCVRRRQAQRRVDVEHGKVERGGIVGHMSGYRGGSGEEACVNSFSVRGNK